MFVCIDCIPDMVVELVEGRKPTAVVSYVMYRTLGGILPHRFADDIRYEMRSHICLHLFM